MRNRVIGYFLLSVVLLFVSCETRKDIFHNNNMLPKVFVNSESRDFQSQSVITSVAMKHGESHTVYFDYTDDNIDKGLNVSYVILSDQPVPEYITCSIDLDSHELLITDNLPATTLNNKFFKMSVKLLVTDYYGDSGEALVEVVDFDNQPATPKIETKRINNLEYLVDASASTDNDGDEIVAYEYLIDGEIVAKSAGYERPDEETCVLNPGMAARKGTYIISTPLSSVKHAFQTQGSHTISVRVKDSLGLWSKWSSVNIDL